MYKSLCLCHELFHSSCPVCFQIISIKLKQLNNSYCHAWTELDCELWWQFDLICVKLKSNIFCGCCPTLADDQTLYLYCAQRIVNFSKRICIKIFQLAIYLLIWIIITFICLLFVHHTVRHCDAPQYIFICERFNWWMSHLIIMNDSATGEKFGLSQSDVN